MNATFVLAVVYSLLCIACASRMREKRIQQDIREWFDSFNQARLNEWEREVRSVRNQYQQLLDSPQSSNCSDLGDGLEATALNFLLLTLTFEGKINALGARQILSTSALKDHTPDEIFKLAWDKQLYNILECLQAFRLSEWNDPFLAHLYLALTYENDLWYDPLLWKGLWLESRYDKHLTAVYAAGNIKLLRDLHNLTRHPRVQLMRHLVGMVEEEFPLIAQHDAVGTIEFFLPKRLDLKALIDDEKRTLLFTKGAIRIITLLMEEGIVGQFSEIDVQNAIRGGHRELLEMAIEQGHVVTRDDYQLAIEAEQEDCSIVILKANAELIRSTIREGKHELLQKAIDLGYAVTDDDYLLATAERQGDCLTVIEKAIVALVPEAIREGKLQVFKRAIFLGYDVIESDFYKAVEAKQLGCMNVMAAAKKDLVQKIIREMYQKDDDRVLRLNYEHGKIELDQSLIDTLAENGALKIIKLIYENEKKLPSEEAMAVAFFSGHNELVKFVMERRKRA